MIERMLTARELADLLGLSAHTILDMAEDGRLPAFRIGGRVGGPVRFRESEVLDVLEGWRATPRAKGEPCATPRELT